MLDKDTFINIVRNTPLVSIDLIIENQAGEILLGKRNNKPAKGYWFVPGGRIIKNETIEKAFQRISSTELGAAMKIQQASFKGVYEHLYDQNFSEDDSFGTHYVVLAYHLKINDSTVFRTESQHESFIWKTKEELLKDSDVHQYTKNYFILK